MKTIASVLIFYFCVYTAGVTSIIKYCTGIHANVQWTDEIFNSLKFVKLAKVFLPPKKIPKFHLTNMFSHVSPTFSWIINFSCDFYFLIAVAILEKVYSKQNRFYNSLLSLHSAESYHAEKFPLIRWLDAFITKQSARLSYENQQIYFPAGVNYIAQLHQNENNR